MHVSRLWEDTGASHADTRRTCELHTKSQSISIWLGFEPRTFLQSGDSTSHSVANNFHITMSFPSSRTELVLRSGLLGWNATGREKGFVSVHRISYNHFYWPCPLWQRSLDTLGWGCADHCMQTINKLLDQPEEETVGCWLTEAV